MYTKKLLLVAALLILAAFAGFAGAEGEAPAGPSENVVLDVLNYVDMSAEEGRTWKTIQAKFEEMYPNIELKIENQYDENFHTKLRARAASGSMPDVVYLWPGARTGYVTDKGLIDDLSKHIDLSKWEAASTAPQGPNGEVFELPFMIANGTSFMYTNNAILNEMGMSVPKTYAELKAMVAPLKAAGYDTIIMPNESSWVMNSCLFSTIVGRLGGADWIVKAVNGQVKFTDDVFVDSLQVVADLYADGVLPQSSILLGYGNGPAEFAAGKAPFMIDGQWRSEAIAPLMNMDDVSFEVFPALAGEVYPNSASSATGTGMGMRTGLSGAKLEAAKTFIEFFAGAQAAEVRLVAANTIPSIKGFDLASYDNIDANVIKKAEFYKAYASSAVVDSYLPTAANDVLNVGMQAIALGDKTPAEVAAEVQEAFDNL